MDEAGHAGCTYPAFGGVKNWGPNETTWPRPLDPDDYGLRTGDPPPNRIINVASEMHRNTKHDLGFVELEPSGRYRGTQAYARSKLANILFTQELARRLNGTGSSTFAVHPGVVATRIAQDGDSRLGSLLWKVGSRWMRTPEEGAATSVYLATETGIERHSGGYFSDERLVEPSAAGFDQDAAVRLWDLSAADTGCRLC
jgi:retinol dehydrogenase-12